MLYQHGNTRQVKYDDANGKTEYLCVRCEKRRRRDNGHFQKLHFGGNNRRNSKIAFPKAKNNLTALWQNEKPRQTIANLKK